jgi:hypothetical protein
MIVSITTPSIMALSIVATLTRTVMLSAAMLGVILMSVPERCFT